MTSLLSIAVKTLLAATEACLAHTRARQQDRIAEEGALALYIWLTGTPAESAGLSERDRATRLMWPAV